MSEFQSSTVLLGSAVLGTPEHTHARGGLVEEVRQHLEVMVEWDVNSFEEVSSPEEVVPGRIVDEQDGNEGKSSAAFHYGGFWTLASWQTEKAFKEKQSLNPKHVAEQ